MFSAPSDTVQVARILVVEDEKPLAAAVKRGLEAEGFAADIALNGIDGEWMAEERPYDAIILDVMLPGRDGLAVCGNLRDRGVWTPILVLTARSRPRDEVRALETGADDYLAKPFAFSVLVARIRALLRRGREERPSALSAGGLQLDPASRRCTRGDTPIELTSREFAVLEFLVRRAGSAVTKTAILDNVWDFDFEGDPNIVEVYVARLRRKIDSPFGTRTIETVRGSGYLIQLGAS
jgi:DNA-binding response OmpR family regulator